MAQACEDKSGIMALPGRANLFIKPSSKNATLAKYPLSSKSVMRRLRKLICGKKTQTEPTPAIIPSVKRSLQTDADSDCVASDDKNAKNSQSRLEVVLIQEREFEIRE